MNITRRRWVLGFLVVAALGLGVGVVQRVRHAGHRPAHGEHGAAIYYCPMHPGYTADRPGDCPICNMTLVKRETGAKKILYWTDPMIPGYKSDTPGKSPMGMDLVPVYEEGETGVAGEGVPSGYAPIQISPQKQQLIGVRTAVVEKRAMTKTIRTVGRVAYDPELYQAQAEYLEARRTLRDAEAGQAADTLVAQARQVMEAAHLRLRLLGLGDALIEELAQQPGPDERLLVAGASGQAWVYAPVYEGELPLVAVGQPVRVEVPSRPGQLFEGTVAAIDAVLDPATRTARVRALLPDPEKALKPELYVNVLIVRPLGEVLAVPATAILDTGTRRIVFVDRGDGVVEPREVTIGTKADGYAEVTAGVQEGEWVVTSGNFLVDSESRLAAALEGADGGGHRHGQ